MPFISESRSCEPLVSETPLSQNEVLHCIKTSVEAAALDVESIRRKLQQARYGRPPFPVGQPLAAGRSTVGAAASVLLTMCMLGLVVAAINPKLSIDIVHFSGQQAVDLVDASKIAFKNEIRRMRFALSETTGVWQRRFWEWLGWIAWIEWGVAWRILRQTARFRALKAYERVSDSLRTVWRTIEKQKT